MDDTRRRLEPARPRDPRSPFRRDRDRILYSAHFARLAEITQVVSPERGYVFHNRLTHSIKVGQIARTIAEVFKEKYRVDVDPDAAEAAGLAHDLGHPPFGHIAEEELDRLVRLAGLPDGFDGNAQSLRIVGRLAVGDALTEEDGAVVSVSGLNLTRTTVAGIIKYPWQFGENPSIPKKWGYYSDDQELFEWARAGIAGFARTLIAEITDWADDVTYAIHDVLDFYRAGLIPLELVRTTKDRPASVERTHFLDEVFARQEDWRALRPKYEDALDGILDTLPFDGSHRYSGSEQDEQAIYLFATELISTYVNAINPAPGGSDAVVMIQPDARTQVDMLKEFVWTYVIRNSDMVLEQAGRRKAIRAVFAQSKRMARKKMFHFFPEPFRQRLRSSSSEVEAVRLAADYVAGMTERELIRSYRRLQGMTAEWPSGGRS